jgi:hypothetical protein
MIPFIAIDRGTSYTDLDGSNKVHTVVTLGTSINLLKIGGTAPYEL